MTGLTLRTHGARGYDRFGCRCETCCAGVARERAKKREGVFARLAIQPSGCLLWTGRTTFGYGYVSLEKQSWRVHRLIYTMFVGPIPDEHELDHLCHTRDRACAGGKACMHRRCANPSHLEPVTRAEHFRRNRNSPCAKNSAATHCPQNHPYDDTNTRTGRSGGRHCRTCHRIEEDQRRAAARGILLSECVNVHLAAAGETHAAICAVGAIGTLSLTTDITKVTCGRCRNVCAYSMAEGYAAVASRPCPRCGALAGARCRAPGGHATDFHAARLRLADAHDEQGAAEAPSESAPEATS